LRPKAAFTFGSKPLLGTAIRRATAGRRCLAIGAEGRPTALVTVEIYRQPDGSRLVVYEFLSLVRVEILTEAKTKNIRWDAKDSAPEIRIASAPKRAASAAAPRANAPTAGDLWRRNESIRCRASRLLTQPIDRYQSAAEKSSMAPISLTANGTNLSSASFSSPTESAGGTDRSRLHPRNRSVTLDGREIVAFEPFHARGRTDGPFTV